MKVVTYNIQFGLGHDGSFDLERIASEVDGADIIALQEVERHWQRSGNVNQPEQLGRILHRYYWAYGPYFDVDASVPQPDGSIKNLRRQFGNMILSKTPILSTRLFPLPKSALRQRHNMVVGVFEGVVALQRDGALRIYNAHLGARSQHDRVAQILSIRDTIRRAPAEGGAWTGDLAHSLGEHHGHKLWDEDATPPPMPESFVLLGDFNLEPKDPEYDYLVGPHDGDLAGFPPGRNLSIPGSPPDTMKVKGLPIPPTRRRARRGACASITPSSMSRCKSGCSGRGSTRRLKGRTISHTGSTSITRRMIRAFQG